MSNYRADQYIELIKKAVRVQNEDDDPQSLDQNTIAELFFPISEKLTLGDTVTVSYQTAGPSLWGTFTWQSGARWS